MTDREIVERADAAIAEEFELDPGSLRPEALFREDLGLDSLDAVDMVVVLEQAFGIKIGKDPAIASIRNVGDMHEFILAKKRGLEKNAS
ncbi:MAG: phosphopantetheine-binding protein [Desulfovibrio sp.]|jgi:acyl carrier protein|nr:phosphopantetheine-binding protein [Desulfovibrio sp.]